jgi:hypothetical protein
MHTSQAAEPVVARTSLLLLALRAEVKWRHWQTDAYAVHQALDALDRELAEPSDRWVEAAQGRFRRTAGLAARFLRVDVGLPGSYDRSGTLRWLRHRHGALRGARAWSEAAGESELTTVLDDILAILLRAAYRLSLR